MLITNQDKKTKWKNVDFYLNEVFLIYYYSKKYFIKLKGLKKTFLIK